MNISEEYQREVGIRLCRKYGALRARRAIKNNECYDVILNRAFAEIGGDALIAAINEEGAVKAEWAYRMLCNVTNLTEAQRTILVKSIDEAEWARRALLYATNLTEGDINTLQNVSDAVTS